MKRILLGIIAVFLSLSVSAQYDKDIDVLNFDTNRIDERDTMMVGAYCMENAERLEALLMQYIEYDGQRITKDGKKEMERLEREIQRTPAQYADAIAMMKKELERLKQAEKNGTSVIGKMYDVKRQIAALMVDGKLHNYDEIRRFRHGRAAVAIREKTKNGSRLIWGFVDKQMNLVVPLKYTKVYDFNNANFRKHSVYDPMEDEDSKGWTTVIDKHYLMGMIDRYGNVKIPCMFTESEHHKIKIKFIPTPWGEYAGVYRSQEKKEGIIDRNGNYTLPPTYSHLVWYTDLQCFGTTGDNRIYFDHKGNRLSK